MWHTGKLYLFPELTLSMDLNVCWFYVVDDGDESSLRDAMSLCSAMQFVNWSLCQLQTTPFSRSFDTFRSNNFKVMLREREREDVSLACM